MVRIAVVMPRNILERFIKQTAFYFKSNKGLRLNEFILYADIVKLIF